MITFIVMFIGLMAGALAGVMYVIYTVSYHDEHGIYPMPWRWIGSVFAKLLDWAYAQGRK